MHAIDRIGTKHRPALVSVTAGALTAAALLSACASDGPATPGMLSGRFIAALGDADMSASAFATGDLGDRDTGAHDTLTLITLPIQEPETPFGQIEVSNSALGPATGLAVTADGKYAFVTEFRGHAPDVARTVDQLPKGKLLTAVDLSEPTKPRVSATMEVGSLA